jgi:phage-related protein
MSAISGAWDYFWNSSIGGLVKAVFGFILAVTELWITGMQFIIMWGLKVVSDAWDYTWGVVKTVTTMFWDWLFPYLKALWQDIIDLWHMIWDPLSSFFVGLWNGIKDTSTGFWNWLFPYLQAIWNTIIAIGKSAWNGFARFFVDLWDTIKWSVSDIWHKITDFFSDSGTMLFNAGKNIIQGLINGITSKINEVTEKVKEITQKIRDHFPFSPAKIGPLSGRGNPFFAGQKISQMLSAGMQSKMGLIAGVSSLVAASAGTGNPSLTGNAYYDSYPRIESKTASCGTWLAISRESLI